MNPMNRLQQMGQLIRGMKNPQQAMINLLGNNSNPMAQKVLEMAKNGDKKGIEEFARNICKEKGVNFDEEISKFKSGLGM